MRESLEKMGVGFYGSVLRKLTSKGVLSKTMSVLVIAGGDRDNFVLRECGFVNVTISNLEKHLSGDEFAPYFWSFQNAESLTYSDNEFDLVIVHAGLHHCHSPHQALLEMYRVSRRATLIFEARDNFSLKVAAWLGVSENYEVSAVKHNGYVAGGVNNSHIPNFIYRWTEYEVRKTIQSYAPQSEHRFLFFYGVRPPQRLVSHTRKATSALAKVLLVFVRAITFAVPKLGNEFGILILKPAPLEHLKPWLTVEEGQVVMKR